MRTSTSTPFRPPIKNMDVPFRSIPERPEQRSILACPPGAGRGQRGSDRPATHSGIVRDWLIPSQPARSDFQPANDVAIPASRDAEPDDDNWLELLARDWHMHLHPIGSERT